MQIISLNLDSVLLLQHISKQAYSVGRIHYLINPELNEMKWIYFWSAGCRRLRWAILSLCWTMGLLHDSDHMVQKLPYWNANCPLGHLKQGKFRLNCFVLDVPVRNLRSSMAVFVPCDHYPAKGPLSLISVICNPHFKYTCISFHSSNPSREQMSPTNWPAPNCATS